MSFISTVLKILTIDCARHFIVFCFVLFLKVSQSHLIKIFFPTEMSNLARENDRLGKIAQDIEVSFILSRVLNFFADKWHTCSTYFVKPSTWYDMVINRCSICCITYCTELLLNCVMTSLGFMLITECLAV